MRRNESHAARKPRRSGRGWLVALCLSIFLAGAAATPALADDYDPSRAGHPLRFVAYVLYPVGFAVDYLILRPAHWLVSHEPMQSLFGHED